MKLAFTLTASAALGAGLLALPAAAAQVINGPTDGDFTVGGLPDGNYRFCSDQPPEDIQRVSGVCFRFRKTGEDIIGNYYYPYKGGNVCVKGKVNQNTVTGQGVEPRTANGEWPTGRPTDDALADWGQEGFLQVGRAELVVQNETPERIRYRSLLLNLNNFYQFNAGPVLPPQNCFSAATDPAYNQAYTVVPDYLTVVGQASYYQQPVYLDQRSIRQVEDGTYRYRTRIGVNDWEAESDLLVNCDQPQEVRLYRTRYYTDTHQISEIEEIDERQTVDPDGPNAAWAKANQLLCEGSAEAL